MNRTTYSHILGKNIFILCLFLLSITVAHAQLRDTTIEEKSYDEIDAIQDQIELLYVKIYSLMDKYPTASYTLNYEDNSINNIEISGIPIMSDRQQLELYLLSLENRKRDIFNMRNRTGIYYVSETVAKPVSGYRDFYDKLHTELTYPEKAKDKGVEGTVYVKFVVNTDGTISNALAIDNIDQSDEYLTKTLRKEAKAAVMATSGDWQPAEVGGVEVASWAMVPVQFKAESLFFRPLY